ncbi:ATP-binding protein [Flavobacterium sp.]|uniref:sensor histidine kinase n=1 Tax=Flavobacterium sp. TaxID=239 RepID=UPI0034361BB4
MRIFDSIQDFNHEGKTILTLGTFDGVHVGHRKIISRLLQSSQDENCDSVILTFFPHPRMVLQSDSDIKLLNTMPEKAALLEAAGLQHLVVHPFDKEFSRLTAEEFVRTILVEKFNIKKIIIGHDHRFGRNRTATIHDLIEFGQQYGFEVEQLSAQSIIQEQEKQQLLARQNEVLEHQVADRTAELSRSLRDLQTTQQQLIQKEKMASLGELTAGIAHEIQNPLNFVNNFSEVSVELLTELEEEQERPADERDVELEKEILGDIKQNISKISHHGQRAASIVKGMLQHSRASTGQREPTDLNALTDEYLRLAYHGIRAKEKTFEVSLVTHFNPDLPAVATIPQDIGRVLMNLFINAFHAVQERTQRSADQRSADNQSTYQPTVTVTTERVGDKVQVRVHDNGTGVPDEVRSKIFQPFFTTKPTGKGTGLGLSLSYDIVTKGHGGTLDLHSEPSQFTEFIVTLPIA